ncbi:hypothetical protein EJF36_06400 [Bacillus sp. HMF5848]|uniref:hypothetical protein n=1 Tax=Bacillus sp. HMF5848 TaxID=2495421 RepID=UPI000F7743E3|nr:hypothetical protein [Bacillus sp. HMF5848]RSK26520.1 hypothetical protein EJF36_06400 [Bacillus sp. HMF5848]
MGYILPIHHVQYTQYANRTANVQNTAYTVSRLQPTPKSSRRKGEWDEASFARLLKEKTYRYNQSYETIATGKEHTIDQYV